ncbi:MAG TPA: hypothetical protein VNS63_20950 [Blastocatellia bacterium]|nr:hypothetical protein [Blastocatellia bacterium]
MKIQVRPAGLEPATLCLEVRFRRIPKNGEFTRKTERLHSRTYWRVVEGCSGLWSFGDLTIYTDLSTALFDPLLSEANLKNLVVELQNCTTSPASGPLLYQGFTGVALSLAPAHYVLMENTRINTVQTTGAGWLSPDA